MNREEKYWEPVFNMFKEDYPRLANEWIDWYPSGQMEIMVKMSDGTKYTYDMFTRNARLIQNEMNNNISENEWRKYFARNLNHKLRNIGMTQDTLSKLSDISKITISKYTTGKATPSGYNLRKIVRALNCSVHELTDI